MTKARQAVLNAVKDSSIPLSAGEIHKKIILPMDLVTVYRALKYLEEHGHLVSFSFACTLKRTERYYYHRKDPHVHFFHCEGCHRFIDMGLCQLDPIVSTIEKEQRVQILSHTLYFTGLCAECLEAKSPKPAEPATPRPAGF